MRYSDSTTFEIVDDQNQAVFQEVYLDPNRVWIKGAVQSGGTVIGHAQPEAAPAAKTDRSRGCHESRKRPNLIVNKGRI
jgi:hypothetical protein